MKRFITLFFIFIIACSHTWAAQEAAFLEPVTETKFTVKQLRDDFQFFYRTLAASQYDLFHRTSKSEYDQAFATALERIDQPLSLVEAKRYFQQFAALAKTAHTRIDFPVQAYREFLERGGKTLPLYLRISEQGAFVDAYYGAPSVLTQDAQLTHVNGEPVAVWLKTLFRYLSADNEALMWGLAGEQIPSLLWWHEGEKAEYQIRFVDTQGRTHEISVPTLNREQQQQFIPAAEDDDAGLRQQRMLNAQIAYLKPGPFYHAEGENIWDTTAFHAFIDEAFQGFQKANASELLIDLRGNPGGTNSFSDHLLAWFADKPFKFAADFRVKVSQAAIDSNRARLDQNTDIKDVSHQLAAFYAQHQNGQTFSFPLPDSQPHTDRRFSGKVYVLIDRFSYSNAVSVAAIVKDYGFGTVLGEKTADLATTHGAMEHFTLPETGIVVGFPKALIVRPNGDTRPDGVSPDVPLKFDSASTAQRDVLKQAMDVITANRSQQKSRAQ